MKLKVLLNKMEHYKGSLPKIGVFMIFSEIVQNGGIWSLFEMKYDKIRALQSICENI